MNPDLSQYWATLVQLTLVFGAGIGIEARWAASHTPYEHRLARVLQSLVLVAGVVGLIAVFGIAIDRLSRGSGASPTTLFLINTFLGLCASALISNPVLNIASGRNLDIFVLVGRLWPWSDFWRTRRGLDRALRGLPALKVAAAENVVHARATVRNGQDMIKLFDENIVDGESVDVPAELFDVERPDGLEEDWPAKTSAAFKSGDKIAARAELCKMYRAAVRNAAQSVITDRKVDALAAESRARRDSMRVLRATPQEQALAREFAEKVEAAARERLSMPPLIQPAD